MPTRLPVLLQRRKSAAAGAANKTANAQASESIPPARRTVRGLETGAKGGIRIIVSRISRVLRRAVNEDGAEVIDVGESGAGAQEVAESFEKSGRVVVGKKRGRMEAELPRACHGVAIGVSPRGVAGRAGPAVGAVGVGGERRNAARARKRDRQRERVFLVRPAAALAVDRDGQLAARQDDGAAARALEIVGLCGMCARDVRSEEHTSELP